MVMTLNLSHRSPKISTPLIYIILFLVSEIFEFYFGLQIFNAVEFGN